MVVLAAVTCLAIATGINAAQVVASDESSVDAEVEVVSAGEESYGARVIDSSQVLLPRLALSEPDSLGACIFRNGWIVIKLGGTVADASMVSIWGADIGWQHSNVKVSVSNDGSHWTRIANLKIENALYQRYDTTGSFGDVRYIKVVRSGTPLSFLFLDAVYARGGD